MSIIKKHAQETGENITGFIGGRVPETLERDFKTYCRKNNISVAAALRLLIEAELKSAGFSAAPAPVDGGRFENGKLLSVNAPADAIKELAARQKDGPGRFVTLPWQHTINGVKCLPCPECKEWKSASNFSRHAKTAHGGITAQELIENNRAVADRMKEDIQKGQV